MSMEKIRIAALDIGGTNIKGCLFEGGKPIQKAEIPTEAFRGAPDMLERAAKLLEEFLPFDVIGISTAGQVDPQKGSIRYANDNIPKYTGTDVKGFFEGKFGVKTAVVNDVYSAALGEGKFGAAVGEQDYICVTYGTGIGGGVVLNGELYYGAGKSAGVMIGGIITHPEEMNPTDHFCGTYERKASATALVSLGKELDPELNSGRVIFSRLDEDKVRAVVDKWLDEVVAGLCTLIHSYNIPCIVLGGGVMEQPYAIEGAKARVEKYVIDGFAGAKIVGAKLGNMAGLYGAASLAEKLILLN